jgi:hypothetical protein
MVLEVARADAGVDMLAAHLLALEYHGFAVIEDAIPQPLLAQVQAPPALPPR